MCGGEPAGGAPGPSSRAFRMKKALDSSAAGAIISAVSRAALCARGVPSRCWQWGRVGTDLPLTCGTPLMLPIVTQEELIAKWKRRPAFRAAYDALENELALFDELLKARLAANLTQADVAARMGTKVPGVSRLESAGGKPGHSPSIAALRKYASAAARESSSACARPDGQCAANSGSGKPAERTIFRRGSRV